MSVEFILNERRIETDESAGMLALDWLRRRQQLTGTKEGCKEGDCGACSVMIGELDDSGVVRYKPVTSCLTPLGELHGKHLLTIEGLNLADAGLTPDWLNKHLSVFRNKNFPKRRNSHGQQAGI